MEEKINEQEEVLLVKNGNRKKLEVVSGIDEKGKMKTAPPKQEHKSEFLKINKNENALENFFSNFLRQVKNPTQFRFFKIPFSKIDLVDQLENLINKPQQLYAQEKISQLEVNPIDHLKQGYKPIDTSRVNWDELAKYGIDIHLLKQSNSLDRMLNWQKSPVLLPINMKTDSGSVTVDARLSFREVNGEIGLNIHPVRNKPDLTKQFYGINFTDQDRHNLLSTGNAGRVINIKSGNAEVPVYVSIDKLTNELVTMNTDKVKIPEEIKGVKINEGQQQLLKDGEAIFLRGMTNHKGETFNSLVQINADKRGFSFRSSATEQNNQESQRNYRPVNIPSNLLGVALSEQQQNSLKTGKSIKLENMRDPNSGKLFDSYVKVNHEKGKFDFSKNDPDLPVNQKVEPAKVNNQNTSRSRGPRI